MKQIIRFFIARLYPYVKPLLYLFVPRRGGVKKNELLKEAAIREVYEEVGIKINNLTKHGFFILPDKGSGKITVFSCKIKSLKFKIDGLEIEEAMWINVNEVYHLHLLPVATQCVKMCSHLLF